MQSAVSGKMALMRPGIIFCLPDKVRRLTNVSKEWRGLKSYPFYTAVRLVEVSGNSC